MNWRCRRPCAASPAAHAQEHARTRMFSYPEISGSMPTPSRTPAPPGFAPGTTRSSVRRCRQQPPATSTFRRRCGPPDPPDHHRRCGLMSLRASTTITFEPAVRSCCRRHRSPTLIDRVLASKMGNRHPHSRCRPAPSEVAIRASPTPSRHAGPIITHHKQRQQPAESRTTKHDRPVIELDVVAQQRPCGPPQDSGTSG